MSKLWLSYRRRPRRRVTWQQFLSPVIVGTLVSLRLSWPILVAALIVYCLALGTIRHYQRVREYAPRLP